MNLDQLTDPYGRAARLRPAILLMLPLSALAVTSVPVVVTVWGKIVGLVVAAGLPFVVSQVVRDRGLRIQPGLFRAWDGRPSEIMLRWRSTSTKSAVARRHKLVQAHLGIQLPDEAAEAADPAEADDAYEVATTALRERTRDKAAFPLLFNENVAYGFRRNAYACRTAAIVVCLVAAAGTVLLARFSIVPLGWKHQTALIVFDLAMAAAWLFWCTEGAVRRSADAYARQLFASLETLGNPPQQQEAAATPQPDVTQ